MTRSSAIYQIRNVINDDVYVGSAVCLLKRWDDHKYMLRRGVSKSTKLQSAWTKYGESNFVIEVLELTEKSSLIAREQFHIDTLKPKYNVCPIAGNSLGVKHDDAYKDKMRNRRLEKGYPVHTTKHDADSKERMRVAHTGVKRGSYRMGCACGTCVTCKQREYSAQHYANHRDELTARRRNNYIRRVEVTTQG